MRSTFNHFYKNIISESKKTKIDLAKEAAKKEIENFINLPEKTEEEPSEKTGKTRRTVKINNTDNTNKGVKTMEKNFLEKFIRYNELQLLMKNLPEITNCFRTIQGFDATLMSDIIQKLVDERQTEMDKLGTELTDLRDSINKEAEEINYKKSIIDLFDAKATETPSNPDDIYGYTPKADSYSKGETIGQPQVDPNQEELPGEPDGMPDEIDDRNQAEQLSADALPTQNVAKPKRTKKLMTPNVLIDSKKKK